MDKDSTIFGHIKSNEEKNYYNIGLWGRFCKKKFSFKTDLHISVQLPKSSVKLGCLYNIVVNGYICTAL